jgi:hypothetical protein
MNTPRFTGTFAFRRVHQLVMTTSFFHQSHRHFPTPPRNRRPFGRIRLSFFVIGVVSAVSLFLLWDRSLEDASFPTLADGRYIGLLAEDRPSGQRISSPMIVDVPPEGPALLIILDEKSKGGTVSLRLPQNSDIREPVIINIAGGEKIQLIGTQTSEGYEGSGLRASGAEMSWILRKVALSSQPPPAGLTNLLDQRAKLALIERRIEETKAGASRATSESQKLRELLPDGPEKSTSNLEAPLERAQEEESSRRKILESEVSKLTQNIDILVSVAPSARVSRAVLRSLAEQEKWIDAVLLGSSSTTLSAEDEQALSKGIEVDALQRAIAVARQRIDAALRASDEILGE